MNIFITVILLFLLFVIVTKTKKYSIQRQLNKCESPIEEMMVKKLYENRFKPYTQVSCGKYRIDISIVKKGKKYAIECDGEAYHSSPEQLEHDNKKDKFLEKNNWIVIRLSGKEIYNDSDWCIKYINSVIKK